MAHHAPTEPRPPELLYLLHGDPARARGGARRDARCRHRRGAARSAARARREGAWRRCRSTSPSRCSTSPSSAHRERRDRAAAWSEATAAALIDAMSADQQADLFRELPRSDRTALPQAARRADTRRALELLLRYPPDTAGGIMTTEFVSMPADWTVEQALDHVARGGAHEGDGLRHLLRRAGHRHARARRLAARPDGRPTARRRRSTIGNRRTPLTVHDAHRSRGRRAPDLEVQPARRARRRRGATCSASSRWTT